MDGFNQDFESPRGPSAPPRSIPAGGRLPPQNLPAEKSVLGAILLQPGSLYAAIEVGLEAADFFHPGHHKIFECIQSLSMRGDPIDLVSLTGVLKDKKYYDAIGGTETLTALFEDGFSVESVSYYARIVREKALLRKVIAAASEITTKAFDGVEDVEAFIDEAESAIFAITGSAAKKGFSSMQQVLVQNMHVIEDMAKRGTDVVGLQTGFTDLDKLTSGLRGGQLMILAARPAMGKTSLFLSMAQNIAQSSNSVVAIFSLEMSEEELGFRFLSGTSRIDSKRLRVGKLADRDWPRLAQAADILSKTRVFIDDSGDLTVMDVRSRCRRLASREKQIDLIVVDYLQLMKGSKASQKGDGSREREISEISRNLKNLAKELKVPIIALSQLNRGVESRPNKRPMLSDLRESGAIEQDADIVCFIYRDEVYNKESEDRGVAELIVAKHRAGETDTIRLAWIPEYTLFANLARDVPGTPIVKPRPDRPDIGL